jgi:hypothetical protein
MFAHLVLHEQHPETLIAAVLHAASPLRKYAFSELY